MLGQPTCATGLHSVRMSLTCTCARQEMRLLCECLMWLLIIPLISTSALVCLELAIICDVYTLFFINIWVLLKGKCSIFLAKKQA